MALGNTPRRETSFAIEASKSYSFGMWFKTPDDLPVDLTTCEVRMVVTAPLQMGGTEVISIQAVSAQPLSGFTWFNLQAEDLALEPGSYPYDVTFYPDSGYSTPIIKGYLEIGANTDPDTSNVYLPINTDSDVTVVMSQGDVVGVTIEQVDGLYVIIAGLIEDFSAEMAAQVAAAEAAAAAAAGSAELSQSYHDDMQVWLDNAGFPFWKGTYAEYQALTPKAEVLYLITDEVVV